MNATFRLPMAITLAALVSSVAAAKNLPNYDASADKPAAANAPGNADFSGVYSLEMSSGSPSGRSARQDHRDGREGPHELASQGQPDPPGVRAE